MRLIVPTMALLAFALVCAPVRAQTPADTAGQQACGNDAFSLCGDAIPDRGRIEACLRRNFSRVSPECRRYMANYGRAHRAVSGREVRRHYRERHHRPVKRHHAEKHRRQREYRYHYRYHYRDRDR